MLTDISRGWKYLEGACGDENSIPTDAVDIDLPADLLRGKNRNYNTALGIYGSYYDSTAATFYKYLPHFKEKYATLEVEGVNQFADVCVNGIAAAHIEGSGKHYVDITEYLNSRSSDLLAIKIWAPQMAGRYAGAGISGGVRLFTREESLFIKEDGVFVSSDIAAGKARLSVNVDLCDRDGEFAAAKRKLSLEAVIFNARGKKTARKVKKIRLKQTYVNTFSLSLNLSRYCAWSVDDPYLYSASVSVLDENGKAIDTQQINFGIVSRALSKSRGLVLGGRGVKLRGAVMSRDNGILGMESIASAEEYKLGKIKSIGYNAVRYIGVPCEAALDALDRIGLMAQIDLFDVWSQGKFPYDGHVRFEENAAADCERFVCQLRKHPSVTLYGLCADAPETYGRGEGSGIAAMLASTVRSLDGTRPVAVNARELVPLASELESAGIKSKGESSIALGREKDLFGNLTADSFAAGDVAGYAYLYPRYSSDRARFPDRLIVGTEEYPSRAFEAFEESANSPNSIGEFVYAGADFLGYPKGKPSYEDEQLRLLPPHTSYCGDLDLIYDYKPAAYYRKIMLGNRGESYITVSSPESKQKTDNLGYAVKETHAVWNWPHDLGKQVEIEVYSGGEVVALYRDGKLVGRKLAGKINKHIATFKTEYYPGKLEAVSYHKGRECSRTTLESVTAPRAVKLSAAKKWAREGELLMVEIAVTDKEGRVVPFASREVEISVTGAGSLYALGCADPEAQEHTAQNSVCHVYNGKALAVIRALGGEDGKISVKAVGDGLLAGKINLRVKE